MFKIFIDFLKKIFGYEKEKVEMTKNKIIVEFKMPYKLDAEEEKMIKEQMNTERIKEVFVKANKNLTLSAAKVNMDREYIVPPKN